MTPSLQVILPPETYVSLQGSKGQHTVNSQRTLWGIQETLRPLWAMATASALLSPPLSELFSVS